MTASAAATFEAALVAHGPLVLRICRRSARAPSGRRYTGSPEATMAGARRRDPGEPLPLSRRRLLRLALAAGVASIALTPEIADADEPTTPPSIEGPYFKPRSPRRGNLRETGVVGTPLVVTGRVLSPKGVPLASAVVDVWHADGNGVYDLRGHRLRGHQLTDERGRYRLETVVPGYYPGRTRHLHVKVQPAGAPVLTTQLFLRGDPWNRRDGLYRDALAFVVADTRTGEKAGTFDFVVRTVGS
jgi:protocatechuate 3,4-dioxygenase beta subunit